MDGWITFFSTLSDFLRETELIECPNEFRLRSLVSEIEFRLSGLIDILIFVIRQLEAGAEQEEPKLDSDIIEVIRKMKYIIDNISSRILPTLKEKLDNCYDDPASSQFVFSTAGNFTEDQLLYLRGLGFKWAKIANIFGTSRMSLYRRRRLLGILNVSRFSNLSDSDLKDLVVSVKELFPDCGERIVLGFLRSRGIFVSRCRLRSVIHEVDPVNTSLRWH